MLVFLARFLGCACRAAALGWWHEFESHQPNMISILTTALQNGGSLGWPISKIDHAKLVANEIEIETQKTQLS